MFMYLKMNKSQNNLPQKIALNISWQITGKVISTILGLFIIGLITRYFDLDTFGKYTTIISFLTFLAIFIDFGLTLVSSQILGAGDAPEDKLFANLFTFRFFSAFLFFGLTPFLIFLFPYSMEIKKGVLVLVLSFFFIALNQVFVALFQKKLRTDIISLAEIIGRIVLFLGILLVIKLDLGLNGVLFSMVVSSLVNFLIHFLYSQKFITKLSFSFDWEIWREILQKSYPLALSIIFNLIYLKSDVLILSLMQSQSEVGIYGAAYRVVDVLVSIPFMFAGIILPILSNLWSRGDRDEFFKILQKSVDFLIILACPLIFGAQILGEEIMRVIAGAKFSLSGEVLGILIIATGMIFFTCIFSHVIIAINKQKAVIWIYVFTALSSLLIYFLSIWQFSYFGAAWGTVYSEFIVAVMVYGYVRRYTGFSFNFLIFFKSFLASFLMFLFLIFLNNFLVLSVGGGGLWLNLILGFFIYLVVLFLLRGISLRDLKLVLGR